MITSLDKKKVNSQQLYKSLNYVLFNLGNDEIDQLEIQIKDKFIEFIQIHVETNT